MEGLGKNFRVLHVTEYLYTVGEIFTRGHACLEQCWVGSKVNYIFWLAES